MNSPAAYLVPASVDEAAGALSRGNATVLAGGTDLMPQANQGVRVFRHTLININRIAELKAVSRSGDWLRIGALVSVTDLLQNSTLRGICPMLAETADHFASDQIRNAATVGGNLCNASPAGDLSPPLLALDASVEMACHRDGRLQRRSLPLDQFFLGPRRTALAENELLTAVQIPLPPPRHYGRFFKLGIRPALDIAIISVALAGVLENRKLNRVRVAFGAVAPTPLRARRAEALLEGRILDEETIRAAAQAAREEVTPITDVRASAWYRSEMVSSMMRRLLHEAAGA
ncbi:MAG: xanthine dehydrogenase family protein subunit M [Gammaproteobacteria bacterium]|nr:xanthine dehydrogenase family protein subunit M [Gammaproteobacteria bacterium]